MSCTPNMAEWPHHLTYITVLTILIAELCGSQRLPTRDEGHFQFQISKAEIFYDTKLLPDGAQVSSYIFKDELNRYFFMVEEDNTPLSITVTPCTSALRWRVSLQDLAWQASGDGYRDSDDDLREQWTSTQPPVRPDAILQSFNGTEAFTFARDDSPAGLYILQVSAVDTDTKLQLFATTTPDSASSSPQKPSDPKVAVTSVAKRSVTVSWEASSVESQRSPPLEYCVFVNLKSNFNTHCAAEAFMYGEAPPTAPPNAGFGFSWEAREREELKERFSTLKGADPRDFHYECIGDKTSYVYGKALPNQLYYFDVFARNVASNMTTAYVGTKAKTKELVKLENLKDGKLKKVFMKRSGGHKVFKLQVDSKAKQLVISLQSCSDKVHVKIFRKRRLLEELDVQGLRKVTLEKPREGVYFVRVEPNRRKSTAVKVFASTAPDTYPYPDLPEDSRIKVFENLSTCNSLTVAWLGTDKKQHYCLYRRASKGAPSWTDRQLDSCLTSQSRKRRDKAVCRSFRKRGRRRSAVTQKLKGLQPDTVYILDVHVRRAGPQTLSYRQTWARTKASC